MSYTLKVVILVLIMGFAIGIFRNRKLNRDARFHWSMSLVLFSGSVLVAISVESKLITMIAWTVAVINLIYIAFIIIRGVCHAVNDIVFFKKTATLGDVLFVLKMNDYNQLHVTDGQEKWLQQYVNRFGASTIHRASKIIDQVNTSQSQQKLSMMTSNFNFNHLEHEVIEDEKRKGFTRRHIK